MPVVFVAHGSPMVAIEDSPYGRFLDQAAAHWPTPRAIVIFSAHWEASKQWISDVDDYDTLYDFGGFPEALYAVRYAAKGEHALAQNIVERLTKRGIPCATDVKRGLDHGSWTILKRLYPQAEVPVVAMSVNPALSPQEQYEIGQSLADLRQDGVLIIGSGVTVHNFQLLSMAHDPTVQKAVRQFEQWLQEQLQAWNLQALFDYARQAPHAPLAVPEDSKEHFVPLFYILGASGRPESVATLHNSWLFDVMSNSVFQFS